MHSPFDILKKRPEGSFCRFEAVNDLVHVEIEQPRPRGEVQSAVGGHRGDYGNETT